MSSTPRLNRALRQKKAEMRAWIWQTQHERERREQEGRMIDLYLQAQSEGLRTPMSSRWMQMPWTYFKTIEEYRAYDRRTRAVDAKVVGLRAQKNGGLVEIKPQPSAWSRFVKWWTHL